MKNDKDVVLLECGIGKVNAAIGTQIMIDYYKPDVIINSGIAGSLSKNLKIGDIVISIPKVYEQAEEYGHSFERELSYMVVHGFYHLMGYDHIQEEDKVIMRAKEEKVLEKLGIRRDEMNEE